MTPISTFVLVTGLFALQSAPPIPPADAAPPRQEGGLEEQCDAGDAGACLHHSFALAAAGKTAGAAAFAERACHGGNMRGCARAGQLLLGGVDTRTRAGDYLQQACDGGIESSCLELGDGWRAGLFGAPDETKALFAYQRGCALERAKTEDETIRGPGCAAVVDLIGEDPFAPSPEGSPPPAVDDPATEPQPPRAKPKPKPPASPPDVPPTKRSTPTPRAPQPFTPEQDNTLLGTRAEFRLGAFVVEGGGRLWLGADSNPWRLGAPSAGSVRTPALAGTLTLAPRAGLRIELLELVSAGVNVGGAWTAFAGADFVDSSLIAAPVLGNGFLEMEAGLGRELRDMLLGEGDGERNLLRIRNRTAVRLQPGSLLEENDIGTNTTSGVPAPLSLVMPITGIFTPGDLVGTSENALAVDARLDFLANLEFGYAWTHRRVDVSFAPEPDAYARALTLPAFFLPGRVGSQSMGPSESSLGALDYDEHAGRARAGLSLPKFDFFGPAHLYGEFSLARRELRFQTLYPTTARAGLDFKADIFEFAADAGAGNIGYEGVFGSATHFVGGLSATMPAGARWWLGAALDRRLIPMTLAESGLVTRGSIWLENRGRVIDAAVHGGLGVVDIQPALDPGFASAGPAGSVLADVGTHVEIRIGPFRPRFEGLIRAQLPRFDLDITPSYGAIVLGEGRIGIGF